MSRWTVWDFEDPVDKTWPGGMFSLSDRWKRLSWALSQQSDGGKVMVFVFFVFCFFLNTMPYPWVVAKFVFCSVTQYCLLNKVHFAWFFFFICVELLLCIFYHYCLGPKENIWCCKKKKNTNKNNKNKKNISLLDIHSGLKNIICYEILCYCMHI